MIEIVIEIAFEAHSCGVHPLPETAHLTIQPMPVAVATVQKFKSTLAMWLVVSE